MSRVHRILLPLLAVLAVGYMQVFGMQVGFLCSQNDEVREMKAEHCHLDASTESFVPCETPKNNCETLPDTEHHAPVSVDLKTNVASTASVTAPVYTPLFILDTLFELEWLTLEAHAQATAVTYSRETGLDKVQLSTAVQTAKCMVLLV